MTDKLYSTTGSAGPNQDVIDHIRERVDRCRRLATEITDKRAIEVLLQMAREGEEDIQRLGERNSA